MKITKLEAAKRQLETAVILYFNDGDPVSIHTLACAAHEIIAKLNKQAGRISLVLELIEEIIKEEYRQDFRKLMREAKNFFKHADKDSDETLDFPPDINDHYLIDACEGYQSMTREENPHFIIYRGWFAYKHPHILNLPSNQIIENRFGNDKTRFFTSMLEAYAVRKDKLSYKQ